MKRIALLRHGKSNWAETESRDFDRTLADRGRRASLLMGQEIKRRDLSFDLVLASPARRVVETLEHVASGYEAELAVSFEANIYTASASELLKTLQALDERTGSVLLVGHNPALQELTLLLTDNGDPLRTAVEQKFPTAGLALLEAPVDRWKALRTGVAIMKAMIKPREIVSDL